MKTIRVFKSGNSQAIRLPRDYRVASSEVEILRRGDEIGARRPPTPEASRAMTARNLPGLRMQNWAA